MCCKDKKYKGDDFVCAKRPWVISPFNERYLFKNQRAENPVFYINATGIVYPDNRYRYKHYKGHCSFQYILKGKGDISCKGKTVQVSPGNLIYMTAREGITYGADANEPYTKIWFNGCGRFFSGMEQIFGMDSPFYVAQIAEEQKATEIFHALFDEVRKESFDETTLMELVLRIFKLLCDAKDLPTVYEPEKDKHFQTKRHSFSTSSATNEIKHYIDMNLFEKRILRNCATHFGISERTFYTHFKRFFGIAPHSYVIEKRLESAREMLLSGKLSVAEVSEKTGFCSATYFNEIFKNRYGLTPQKYKKNHAQKDSIQDLHEDEKQ